MACGGALGTAPPIILGKLVDGLIHTQTPHFAAALPYLFAMIAAITIREAIQVARKYLVENTATQVDKRSIVKVMERVVHADAQVLGNEGRVGAIHGRISRSLEGLIRLMKLTFLDLMPVVFTSVFAFAVVAWKKPLLGGVMTLSVVLGVAIVLRQLKTQKGIRIDLLRVREEIDGRAIELLGGLDYVKAANTGDIEVRKIEDTAERRRQKEIRHHLAMSFYDAYKYINEGICQILFLSLCILLSVRGAISPGDILTYAMLFASFVQPLRELHRIIDEAHESSIRVEDLNQVLNLPRDPHTLIDNGDGAPLRMLGSPMIELKGVSASYLRNNNEQYVALRDVNLAVRDGERLGLAGASGSGKSTLMKMLLGLVPPDSGTVSICGTSLGELSRSQIAALFGYVSQNPFLFAGTISENILYGCGDCAQEQIVSAARMANIHDEIVNVLGGYDGHVAERGRNLSGGQQQRIAIARIFLKRAPILLLDEATSALDTNSESLVNKAIDQAMLGRTVIAIAHRLSTLRNMNRIVVLEKGRIAEEGTFSGLSNHRGAFFQLNEASFVAQSRKDDFSCIVAVG
jgi:ATP-binding cassette subfamily B protein